MVRLASGMLVVLLLLGVPGGMVAHGQGYAPPPGPYGAAPGPFDPYNAPPPPRAGGEVDGEAASRMLAARGFTNIQVVRRRGPTLVMEANGPRGERVQVIVDSASGAINGMKVIGFGDKRY